MKQIGKPLTLDILETARALDLALGHYMFPYDKGLYLPGSATPRIVFGAEYVVIDRRAVGGLNPKSYTGEEIYNMHPRELRGDIWQSGQLLVPAQTIPMLAKTPYIPHRSVLLVQRVLERVVNRHYFFTRGEIPDDELDILQDALISKIDFKEKDPSRAAEYDHITSVFEATILDIVEELERFMGDDIYCAHVVDSRWDVAYITKHEDQRIADFNNLIAAIERASKTKSVDERELDAVHRALNDIILNASIVAKGGNKVNINFDLHVDKR